MSSTLDPLNATSLPGLGPKAVGTSPEPNLFAQFPRLKSVIVLQCGEVFDPKYLDVLADRVRSILKAFSVEEASLFLLDSDSNPKMMNLSSALVRKQTGKEEKVLATSVPLASSRLSPLVVSTSTKTGIFIRIHTALIEKCAGVRKMEILLIVTGRDAKGYAHAINLNLPCETKPTHTKDFDIFVVTQGEQFYVSHKDPVPESFATT